MMLQTLQARRALARAANTTAARTMNASVSASALFPAQHALLLARGFSAGVGGNDDKPHKPLTPFQKLQKWMQPFVTGSKALFAENKQAWAIRARLKQDPRAALSRQEMMILRQAHRDLAKSLPLLVFFAVPLVGYAAPLVGYQFPKQLLPWQFWRPDQKTQFFREDARARAVFYPELVQLLEQIDRKDNALRELLTTARGSDNVAGLNPAQVSELAPFFEGPAALPALTSSHVHVLARSIALVPAFSWVWSLLPRGTVEQFVARRMEQLRVDDAMLLKEGIAHLSLSELEFACEERGIVDGYGDLEKLRTALGDWLAMYDAAGDAAKTPAGFPTSLLLHAPALLNPTGRAAP